MWEILTRITAIMSFGVMMTPALAVDGEIKVAGKIPSADELRKILCRSRSMVRNAG